MTMTKPPSLMHRARIAFNVFRSGYPRALKQSPFIWPAMREGHPQWQITDFGSYITEGFQLNTLIYSAIMYKVRSAYYAPLRAYSGDEDRPEAQPLDHPLAALAHRPNSYQSGAQFMGANTVFLNISGNSYVMLDRPKAGALPTAMYPLRPDRVWIIPSDRSIKGYLYVPEGKSPRDGVPILPDDMIHVRLPNPGDPLESMGYGLSPFAAMARSADVDNAVTNYLKLFFQRGTAMNVYLKFDVPMDDATISQVKHRFQEIYGGYEKWSDVGVIDQGGEIKQFGQNFKEMGFEAIDDRNESRVLGPFGVPGILIGTRLGVNRAINANAKELRQMFWEDTMLPELGLHEAEYQYYLRSDDGAYVMFDTSKVPALRKDIATTVNAWAQLVGLGVPKDTASSVVGLELGALPDGDVVYMPLSLIPMGIKKPAATVIDESAVPDATNPEQQPEGKARRNSEAKIADLIAEAKDLAIAALQPAAPPVPVVDVHVHLSDQPAPIVNVYNEVQPTPVQIDQAQIQNNIIVEPTPVTIAAPQVQNSVNVEPTPVNVNITPPTVENKNEITVQPATTQVEIMPTVPHTEVTDIERDAQGNIVRTIKHTIPKA